MLQENLFAIPARRLAVAASVVVLAGLTFVATGSSAPATATAMPAFAVRGVAFCLVYHRVERLVCQRRGKPTPLSMRPRGPVRTDELELKEPVAAIVPRQLTVGETWTQGRRFRCRYRQSGLTCRNASGHGWWLGRGSAYRIF